MPKSTKWSSLCKIALQEEYQEEKLSTYLHQIAITTPCGSSALHFAILGNIKSLQWLLKSIPIEYVALENDYGETALHWAAKEGSPGSVTPLLNAGANIYHKDGEGDTPLDWAIEYEREEIILLLSPTSKKGSQTLGNN